MFQILIVLLRSVCTSPIVFYLLLKLTTINDKKDYQVVNAAMRATKLSLDDCNVIWKLLASILHLVSNFAILYEYYSQISSSWYPGLNNCCHIKHVFINFHELIVVRDLFLCCELFRVPPMQLLCHKYFRFFGILGHSQVGVALT